MKKLREYLIITIGIVIAAIGLEFFFFQNNIAAGGVSGFALVIQSMFNIDPGIVMTVCNVILFILAFLFIGGDFGAKSVYAAFTLSTLLSLMEKFGLVFAVTDNLMLATIFGSAVVAIGSSIVFAEGASTGGTNITAKLLNKYCSVGIGTGLLISDSTVIVLAAYTFGIELALYGLLSVYLTSTLIDRFIDGFKARKQVAIFTEKEDIVVNYIMNDVKRGCTVFKGKGGYTGKANTVIYTVLDRRQFIQLRQFMKKEDPKSFITVNEVTEVLGEGFDNIVTN